MVYGKIIRRLGIKLSGFYGRDANAARDVISKIGNFDENFTQRRNFMCAVVKKTISGNQLIREKIVTINTILPNDKYIFLKGVVYSPQKEPLSGAAIDIVQINSNVNPPLEKNIGVTFTLENGSYGVPLLWRKGYSYKITAYSPA